MTCHHYQTEKNRHNHHGNLVLIVKNKSLNASIFKIHPGLLVQRSTPSPETFTHLFIQHMFERYS